LIVIIAQAGIGFPNGTAPTARVSCYAKGLNSAGAGVFILCLGPSEQDSVSAQNKDLSGTWNDIPFEYCSISTVRSGSRIGNKFITGRALIHGVRRILQLASVERIDAILLYSSSYADAAIFHWVSKRIDALYLADVCETPSIHFRAGFWGKIQKIIYDFFFFKLFNGFLVISRYLQNYVMALVPPSRPTLLTPVMVDIPAFSETTIVHCRRNITYCGLLNDVKDGVGTLLNVFSRISQDYLDCKLVLIGGYYSGDRVAEYRKRAELLGIGEKVVLTGPVNRDEIPGYLARSTVLVLARPNTQQTQAGFPTKLGEYLASGRPVVTTLAGEIGNYLDDGVSAFLVEPCDENALEAAIRYVMENPDIADQVGARGRDVAATYFDERVVGRQILEFITQIKRQRKMDK